jgi:hypothetical protein
VILDTRHDGDAATAQEASLAGDLRGRKTAANQGINEPIAVTGAGNYENEFQTARS